MWIIYINISANQTSGVVNRFERIRPNHYRRNSNEMWHSLHSRYEWYTWTKNWCMQHDQLMARVAAAHSVAAFLMQLSREAAALTLAGRIRCGHGPWSWTEDGTGAGSRYMDKELVHAARPTHGARGSSTQCSGVVNTAVPRSQRARETAAHWPGAPAPWHSCTLAGRSRCGHGRVLLIDSTQCELNEYIQNLWFRVSDLQTNTYITNVFVWDMSHVYMWRDSFFCVTWPVDRPVDIRDTMQHKRATRRRCKYVIYSYQMHTHDTTFCTRNLKSL